MKNTARMLIRVIGVIIAILVAVPASAQLTVDQKRHDFENLAALYAKRYAPYEWKKELLGFDLLEIGPWLDRVSRSADDLEFSRSCSSTLPAWTTHRRRSACHPASWRTWA
jgi:hypothetical protein